MLNLPPFECLIRCSIGLHSMLPLSFSSLTIRYFILIIITFRAAISLEL
jgi:hypothetical protein